MRYTTEELKNTVIAEISFLDGTFNDDGDISNKTHVRDIINNIKELHNREVDVVSTLTNAGIKVFQYGNTLSINTENNHFYVSGIRK